jgi:predicted metal-binding membrane protein
MFNVQALKQPTPLAFLFAFATAFAVAVAGTVHFCRSMSGGMDMPGGWTMSMMWMPMPGYTWTGSAVMFVLMWLVMMVAMMLPSALPMLLNIRRWPIHNFEALAIFAALGYFFIWTLIGGIVYALGAAYAMETMRLDWLGRLTPMLSGVMLTVCGIIQFTPWKLSALRQCRAPDCGTLFRDGVLLRGWRYGLRQGISCAICCAAPMLALLVLGVMNLTAMVIIAAVIAAEKLLPWPEKLARAFGVIALLAGAAFIVKTLFIH